MALERETTLEDILDKFIKHRQAMNVSPETIKDYTVFFKRFIKFYGDNRPAAAIGSDDIINFILWVEKNNPEIAKTSVNTYLRHVRAVFYFAMEAGLTPRFKITLIRAEKRIKETYTDEELEKLLKKPKMTNVNFVEFRNWVLINYMMGTGNRLRTIIGLRIDDIDFSTHEIKLRTTKNKKAYTIPLSCKLENVLKEYLRYRQGGPDDFLFCSEYGEQLTDDGLATIIKKYNHSRGVTKTSIHLFRHTFAKKWILNHGDMFRLQKILGHSSLDIVKEYVNMFGQDLRLDFDSFNPLDNLSFYKDKEKIRIEK